MLFDLTDRRRLPWRFHGRFRVRADG